MAEPWAKEEMRSADLKDARLNARLVEVLSALGGRPTASIPQACGGYAEMAGAYRLFDNEKATFERVLEPHLETTRRRVGDQPVVVLAQDTTEVDLTRPERQVEGAGPLDGGARRGLLLHLLHAFGPDGTPLGTLWAKPWTREEDATCAPRTRAQRAATPIELKESVRWLEALRQAQKEALRWPATRTILVSDSEADIYEFLAEAGAQAQGVEWIVRSCQDRALQSSGVGEMAARVLSETVQTRPVLFTQTIPVRGRRGKVSCEARGRRQPRQSREACVEARSGRVVLRPPWRADRQLAQVAVNVVLVREVSPPEGEEPVEWLLLTSLPVEEASQAREVIALYCGRWMIEVFFRVLKSGCRVEERRFESLGRLQACLAVYLIVAWRTLYVCRLGRGCPELDCEAVFEPAEWKSVWKVVRRSDPPRQPPSLGEILPLVAQLGGYVKRKNSPPGPQTVWIGLQRMQDFATCWNLFGPGAHDNPTLA